MSVTLSLRLYGIATHVAALAMPLWLRRRAQRGKEDPSRLGERFGLASAPRPTGPLIWCHAASVGETLSILPLLEALAERGVSIVFTTGTVTSAQLLKDRPLQHTVHQFAPLDHGPWLRRFLDHWRPDIALRVDSDIWPNTLITLRNRAIPIVQVNARMSAPSAARWKKYPGFAAGIFSCLDLVLAQSEGDRVHFADLGARNTITTGNLKLGQPPLPYDGAQLAALRTAIGARSMWLAASIHPGEDQIVGRAHQVVQKNDPNTLLIIVPRHPERAADMAATFQSLGLSVAQRSLGQTITPQTKVYLADTMGELGLFYRLAKIVFMGKSFTVGGGQNPAEPAQIGCALIWGPEMSNFTDLATALEHSGAAIKLDQPYALGGVISELLSTPVRVERMALAGRSYVADNAGALARTLNSLAPYLDRMAIR
ncbi:MAG: 3-deoxy-D-manno-octulosonic acid transferase [Rhodospirillaceae bacterium]|nr:3-deoxy-D-manno-octulosonic acid transferase [Rhodospirillaceae bacterium]